MTPPSPKKIKIKHPKNKKTEISDYLFGCTYLENHYLHFPV